MSTLQIQNPELATFIHNKRCGGTSISQWLIHNFNVEKFGGKHKKYSKVARQRNLGYTFAVVRNPWDRCVSAFFYNKRKIAERKEKIARGKTRKYKPYEIAEIEKAFDYDFSDWLLKHQDWNYLNVSQYEFVNGVDYILKFENLDEDFKVLQERFGCDRPLPKKNVSTHTSYRDYYTQETIDLVEKKCFVDIEKFNYEY